MIKARKLGIWMDHASANLMVFTKSPLASKTIASKFTHEVKALIIAKSERMMHNKEQHEQHEYYNQIGDLILGYDEVILFGPTDAKLELYNILKADHHFAHIKIAVEQTDKMTEQQQHAFVREYFQKN